MNASTPPRDPFLPMAGSASQSKPASIPSSTVEPRRTSERLWSLDVYRGLIMVFLAFNGFGLAQTARNYLGENPESEVWRIILHQFRHAEWVGGGFWDFIQPSFMFMVGVSMAYSYVSRQAAGHSRTQMLMHACRRAAVLIFLGVFLISNSSGATNWSLTNVLTQIGLGYPFLFLLSGRSFRVHVIAAVTLLAGTWVLYSFYPHAGIPLPRGAPHVGVTPGWAQTHLAGIAPAWHKNATVGHAIDLKLLNTLPRRDEFRHNSGGYHTINFIPSLATMLFGLMCGDALRSKRSSKRKAATLALAGVVGIAAGLLFSELGVPLVKRIWTPSWAVYSGGWCCLILAGLYLIVDVLGWRRWSIPFVVVGLNSIAIYCMSMLMPPWTAKTLQTHFGEHVFNVLGTANAPFVQATLVGLLFWSASWWMYRRNLFLRI